MAADGVPADTSASPPEGAGAPRAAASPSVGDYRLVGDAAALAALVGELVHEPAYAVDTEFHRERTYYPKLALLQVAWPRGIALVDPLAVDVAPFAEVLSGPGLAVLHAADQDLEVLERACGCVPTRLFDTQLAAGFLGMSTPSLSSLVERMLGTRLEKGDQLTDWTRRPLTEAQRRYAAGDVVHLLELRELISARLTALGRLAWADEECEILLRRSRASVVPEEAWWRLKHARQLHRRERGVAQSVAAWRERRARALDQPTRFVLSDLALVSIAHRPPSTRAELEQVRNLDVRQLGTSGAADVLAAVEEGLALPAGSVRLPPTHRGEGVARPAVAIATAWLGERARQLEIDPAILATRADLAEFFQDRPGGRLVSSWRDDLVGEPLRRLAAGDAALALDRGEALVLEERSRRPFELAVPHGADARRAGTPVGAVDLDARPAPGPPDGTGADPEVRPS
ncbi:MAG TPA: HRDC domain-containing protein [Acidimicrobiales bacterium]|nr:HRDC domain-containing protein [Acidimicrobiales bacterium]